MDNIAVIGLIVGILFLIHEDYLKRKLIKSLEEENKLLKENNKTVFVKTPMDYSKVTVGQKELICKHIERLQEKYTLTVIANMIGITPPTLKDLRRINKLNISRKSADRYIKILRDLS